MARIKNAFDPVPPINSPDDFQMHITKVWERSGINMDWLGLETTQRAIIRLHRAGRCDAVDTVRMLAETVEAYTRRGPCD